MLHVIYLQREVSAMFSLPSDDQDLFHDLRIVEIGQYVAAPLCGELFAHGGADVIAVESLMGSPTRFSPPGAPDGIQFVSKARGKRSISVDLAHPDGLALVRDLCLSADVVISNLRPGLANRLGIGFDSLAEIRPELIFAEVDGFGESGEDRGCVDIVAQAAAGLVSSLALSDKPEVRRDVLLTDVTAGVLLAFGISSALLERERSGRGQRVATSLVAAALTLQVRTAHIVGNGQPSLTHLVDDIAAGVPFEEVLKKRNQRTNQMYPTYGVFAAADGWVAIGAARTNASHLLRHVGLDPDTESLADPTLSERLRDAISAFHVDSIVAAMEQRGVPAARVRLLEEFLLDDSQIEAGFLSEFEHERIGRVRLPAAPVRFSRNRYQARTHVPDRGADNHEVLLELGRTADQITQLITDGVVKPPTHTPDEEGSTR